MALFLGPGAGAGIENRNIIPFGEREAILGNTGTAGVPSTGAVYYNPAALAQLENSRIAVSGSTYAQQETTTGNFARIDNTDLPYSNSGFNAIPSTVISVFRNDDWIFSYFILVPESARL